MIKFFTYLESLGNQLLSVYVSWFISLTIFIIPGEKFPLTVFFFIHFYENRFPIGETCFAEDETANFERITAKDGRFY